MALTPIDYTQTVRMLTDKFNELIAYIDLDSPDSPLKARLEEIVASIPSGGGGSGGGTGGNLASFTYTLTASTNNQTRFTIPLSTYDNSTDLMFAYQNGKPLNPMNEYTVTGLTIDLIEGVVTGTEIFLLIIKSVFEGDAQQISNLQQSIINAIPKASTTEAGLVKLVDDLVTDDPTSAVTARQAMTLSTQLTTTNENVTLVNQSIEGIQTGIGTIQTGIEAVQTGISGIDSKLGATSTFEQVEVIKTAMQGVESSVKGLDTRPLTAYGMLEEEMVDYAKAFCEHATKDYMYYVETNNNIRSIIEIDRRGLATKIYPMPFEIHLSGYLFRFNNLNKYTSDASSLIAENKIYFYASMDATPGMNSVFRICYFDIETKQFGDTGLNLTGKDFTSNTSITGPTLSLATYKNYLFVTIQESTTVAIPMSTLFIKNVGGVYSIFKKFSRTVDKTFSDQAYAFFEDYFIHWVTTTGTNSYKFTKYSYNVDLISSFDLNKGFNNYFTTQGKYIYLHSTSSNIIQMLDTELMVVSTTPGLVSLSYCRFFVHDGIVYALGSSTNTVWYIYAIQNEKAFSVNTYVSRQYLNTSGTATTSTVTFATFNDLANLEVCMYLSEPRAGIRLLNTGYYLVRFNLPKPALQGGAI